ncbi:MAG: class I SAM-dependent methyltransferase [Chloroflexi bacterium]|nr:class I SAM-dependent methyltransferase [Chloroflexota bacterium]MCI0578395.1 class I SAM-dependent methyltransferase [Chloroflexota bacterium]MCI0647608.1 class I SAM-dependent methyltransferase [Chloroflexota bacterium]MCI0730423.1 class I SAM-dependent methyltransferase [Chloroflexota bacterium]
MTTSHDAPPQIFEYDYYRRLYDIEERHWWAMGMRDIMAGLLRRPLASRQPLRVLDAGCGTGLLLNYLERYQLVKPVTGIDISTHALSFCRQRGATALALASAIHPPFIAGTFDLIICLDTLQHLSPAGADQVTLEAFARLLRPGGLLYIRTNSALGHARLRGADPDQYRRYSRFQLKGMVIQAGLDVGCASYVNVLPSLWAMLGEYWPWRPPVQARAIGPGLAIRPPRLAQLNRLLRGLLQAEAWLIGRLGLELPFGHSIVLLAHKRQAG